MADLTQAMITDFDPIEFLSVLVHHIATVLGAAETGIMLTDSHSRLTRVASTSERMRTLELFELQTSEGPCLECVTSGIPIIAADLSRTQPRWPRFTPIARATGFEFAYAFPLRFHEHTIGAMNVFLDDSRELGRGEVEATQAFANLAAIAVSHRQTENVVDQLEHALTSRVVIEQAKGVLAEHLHCDVDDAFELMRSHARSTNQHLTDVATRIRDRKIQPTELIELS